MPYILDADWIIDALAGKRYARVTIERLAPQGLAVSVITLGEIYEGAFHYASPETHLAAFRRFLAPFRLVGINEPIMERFAQIRSNLRREGKLIPDFDLLLAATALHYDLTVLTGNRRHFARIPALKLYHGGKASE